MLGDAKTWTKTFKYEYARLFKVLEQINQKTDSSWTTLRLIFPIVGHSEYYLNRLIQEETNNRLSYATLSSSFSFDEYGNDEYKIMLVCYERDKTHEFSEDLEEIIDDWFIDKIVCRFEDVLKMYGVKCEIDAKFLADKLIKEFINVEK